VALKDKLGTRSNGRHGRDQAWKARLRTRSGVSSNRGFFVQMAEMVNSGPLLSNGVKSTAPMRRAPP